MAFQSPNITGRHYRKRCKNIFSTILLFSLAHMEPRAVTFFEWSWYILYNGKCFAKSNAFKQWRVSFSHIMIICKIHNVVLWVEQYPLWILIVVHVRRVDDAARFTSCNFLRLMITISLYHSITVNSDVARKSNFTFPFKYNLQFYKSDDTLHQGISYYCFFVCINCINVYISTPILVLRT